MSAQGNPKYRILSLDGGGCWALIQVRALLEIYGDVPGPDILSRFDLVAANSGGSIVAASLIEGLRLSSILGIFMSKRYRDKLFVRLPWYKKLDPRRLFLSEPQYSTKKKLSGLRKLLPNTGNMPLERIPVRIGEGHSQFLITAFDYDRERAVFFRSNTKTVSKNFSNQGRGDYFDGLITLSEAVHASSTAPILYFDKPAEITIPISSNGREQPPRRFWDGGVAGYNNPVLAAVTESLANNIDPNQIEVLSIGTGSVFLPLASSTDNSPLTHRRETPSITGDIRKMANAILDDPPDAATYIAYVALGQPLPSSMNDPVRNAAIIRLNPLVQPVRGPNGEWRLPGWNSHSVTRLSMQDFQILCNMPMDAIEDSQIALIYKFCTEWIESRVVNQPIRAGHDLECEIGQPTFSEGIQAWKNLDTGS